MFLVWRTQYLLISHSEKNSVYHKNLGMEIYNVFIDNFGSKYTFLNFGNVKINCNSVS